MTDEDAKRQLEEQQRAGEEAQRILGSDLFNKVFDDLRELYIRDAVSAQEATARLDRLKAVEVLEHVRGALGAALMAGKASQAMLGHKHEVV
jgi:hypothetical protein